ELKEAIRSWTFVKLVLSILLISTALTGALVHFVPLLISFGNTPKQAATVASVIGGATIAGRLMSGILLDRFNGALIGAIVCALPVLAFASLLAISNLDWQLFFIAMLIGLSVGAELEITAYLVARHFGMFRFATLFSI